MQIFLNPIRLYWMFSVSYGENLMAVSPLFDSWL